MSLRTLVVGLPLIALMACTSKEGGSSSSASSIKPIITAYIDAWNRRDSRAIDSLMAAEGTHEDVSHAMVAKGPAGVHEMIGEFLNLEPDFVWTIKNVTESGSTAAVEWTWTGTYSGPDPHGTMVKNVPVNGRGVSIAEVENGKIKRFTDYYDDASFFPKPDSAKKSG